MVRLNFNLRNPCNCNKQCMCGKRDSKTPIRLIARWNNNKLRYHTGLFIQPGNWESDDQKAKITKRLPENSQINTRLTDIEKAAQRIFDQYVIDQNQEPSKHIYLDLLKKSFSKGQPAKLDYFGYMDQFIEVAKTKINDKTGRAFSSCTISAYRNTVTHLKEFEKTKRFTFSFDAIDLNFYQAYREYLNKVHLFANNTVGKDIKNIKAFLNWATSMGINKNLSYKQKDFKVITEKTDSIYLSEKELQEFAELDLSATPRLDRVRDLFLVGCWTGLRYSDFSRLKPENISKGFIKIETQKTAEPVIIPVHPTVKGIIKKYDNSIPTPLSNVKMNEYLKEVSEKVADKFDSLKVDVSSRITKGGMVVVRTNKKHKLVTTHTARRSFATNMYLDEVPTLTIMKITGHLTEKAFLRYIKITPDDSAKILQLHWQKKTKLKAV